MHINRAENLIRVWKARIVSLWLSLEMSAVVIHNIMYSSEDTFADYMTGLEDCSVVAFIIKGHIRNHEERRLTKAAVKSATGKKWVPFEMWQASIDAKTANRLTKEQRRLLDNGHWSDKK